MKFSKPDSDFVVTASDLFSKALFWHLSSHRNYFYSFDELINIIQNNDKFGDLGGREKISNTLKANLLSFVLKGALSFSLSPSSHTQNISEKPVAYNLARYQARLPKCTAVTNLNGAQIGLNSADPFILRYLDGTKNLAQLMGCIIPHLEKRDFSLNQGEYSASDISQQKKLLKTLLPQFLENYCKKHLLMR